MTRTKKPEIVWPLGSLSPSKPGRNYILPPQNFYADTEDEKPTRVVNASQANMTAEQARRLTNMEPARVGALDYRKHPSVGQGC